VRIAVIGIAACLASSTVAAQDTDAPVSRRLALLLRMVDGK